MAEIDCRGNNDGDEGAPISPLNQMAMDLNQYGALLNGIEEICKAEDIGGDALFVAGTVCGQINHNLCTMADRLDALQRGMTSSN